MEKHYNTLGAVLKAVGYSPFVIVKLNKGTNRVEIEIAYFQEGHAETVYNRIKDAIS